MASDSFRVEVVSENQDHFEKAFEMAFYEVAKHREPVVTHYCMGPEGLTFYWSSENNRPEITLLPYKMDVNAARDFALNYLRVAEYGSPAYTGDGSVKKGWLVTTQTDLFYGVCRVKPEWMVYSK